MERRTNGRFPHLFLSQHGTPYGAHTLRNRVVDILHRYTGKACHPHLIRTIWATEYIRATGNVYLAAVALNDRLETVVRRYSHLTEQGVAAQLDQWARHHFAGREKEAAGPEPQGALQLGLDAWRGQGVPARRAASGRR